MRNEVEKAELVNFLTQVQKTILSQKKLIKDINFKMERSQKENFLFLIDLLENFNNLYDKISPQKDRFDDTSLRVFRSFDIIRKKISNHLESHHVQRIDLEEGKVEMGLCEVIETESVNDQEMKGKIKSVVSHGYMYSGKVLKSARVITYR